MGILPNTPLPDDDPATEEVDAVIAENGLILISLFRPGRALGDDSDHSVWVALDGADDAPMSPASARNLAERLLAAAERAEV